MGDNLKIRVLREKLIATLNESALPIELKRMTLKEVLDIATELADKTIQMELEAEKKAQEEANEKESEENGL